MSLRNKVSSIGSWAFTPSDKINDPYEYQRAKLLLSIFNVILPIGIITALATPFFEGNRLLSPELDARYVVFSLVGWVFIYILARTRFFKISARVASILSIAIILIAAIPDQDYEDYFYLVFVLMFTGLFFSHWELFGYIFTTLLAILILPGFLHSHDLWGAALYPSIIVALGGLLALIGAKNLRAIERLQHQDRLDHEKRYRLLLENTGWGTAIIRDGIIIECDQTFARMLQHSPEELIEAPIHQIFTIRNIRHAKSETVELEAVTKGSETLHVEMLSHHTRQNATELNFIAIRDITPRKKKEQSLVSQANRDPLTKLYNRSYLMRYLETQINIPKGITQTSVLFIDLNNFKCVNDQYGHQMGDHLLRIISNRLQSVVRDDDIVARYGGDEFVIVCQCPLDVTNTIAQRARSVLEKTASIQGQRFSVGASIGVVPNIQCFKHAAEVLKVADEAMYLAKDQSKKKPGGESKVAISYPRAKRKKN